MAGKVVLLGDSVFDNAAYVAGGPAVLDHLRAMMPAGMEPVLLALDGAVMADLPRQVDRIPRDASHLIVSVGGNDALRASSVLLGSASTVAESLALVARVRAGFGVAYRDVVARVAATGLPAAFCTIYDPRYPDPGQRAVASTALAALNDQITRAVARAGHPLIDLRLTCSDDRDFANPIEPSAEGGRKIAAVIRTVVSEHDFDRGRTTVYV
ncbi:SGNH/GDSL hydrolase family protein [Chthonobacter rhizosphaerae]|uniref:SGNH/GDSL hydrolase family protein n=1 Tax=Chthonobacter rhizosphaerae TaxID=2735553 RepID=UPI0015EE6E0C|nr:SGNH/GDSL hydrolase family protein [Chthonobacter rhizosphaerae]